MKLDLISFPIMLDAAPGSGIKTNRTVAALAGCPDARSGQSFSLARFAGQATHRGLLPVAAGRS